MNIKLILPLIVFILGFQATTKVLAQAQIPNTLRATKGGGINSWKQIRDKSVIKQTHDFSCGAAASATLLNGFYGESYTEKRVLDVLNSDGKSYVSFWDLTVALDKLGYKAVGYAGTYEQLKKINVPVIVYLELFTSKHFVVIRSISENSVHIADPYSGNVTLNKRQFLRYWAISNDTFPGKFLVVLPKNSSSFSANNGFFMNKPIRRSLYRNDFSVEDLRPLLQRQSFVLDR